MDLQLQGKLKLKKDVQTFDSGFTKREFVITTEEQYPQDVQFELIKDKTGVIDQFQEGQLINVHFNVRGREYQGRYFVNLNAWRIETAGAQPGAENMPTGESFAVNNEVVLDNSSEEDDLPF